MKRFLIVLFVLFCASSASAQYAVATIDGIDGNTVRVKFTGSGVDPVTLTYVVGASTTGPILRTWRDEQMSALNTVSSFISSAKLVPGAVIPAGPGPAQSTAKQVWQNKADRLVLLQERKAAVVANGGTPNATFTSEINALAADVGSTYAAGFGN